MGNACLNVPRKLSFHSLLSSKSSSKNSLELELDAIHNVEQIRANHANNQPMTAQEVQRIREAVKIPALRTRASLIYSKVSKTLSSATSSQGGQGSKNDTEVVSLNEENIDRHVGTGSGRQIRSASALATERRVIDDRIIYSDDYDFLVSSVALSEDGIMGVIGCAEYQGVCTNLLTNESFVLRGHTEGVTAVAIKGSVTGQVATGSRDGSVRLFNLEAKQLIWTFHLKAPVHVLMFSRNYLTSPPGDDDLVGNRLLASDCVRIVACWNVDNPQEKPTMFMDKSPAVWAEEKNEHVGRDAVILPRAPVLVVTRWNFSSKVFLYVRRQSRLLIFDVIKRSLVQSPIMLPHVPRFICTVPMLESITTRRVPTESFLDNLVTVSEDGMELFFSATSNRPEKRIVTPYAIYTARRWGGKRRAFTSTAALSNRSCISVFVYDEVKGTMIWSTNIAIYQAICFELSEDGRYIVVGHGTNYSKFDLFEYERGAVVVLGVKFLARTGRVAKKILSYLVPTDG